MAENAPKLKKIKSLSRHVFTWTWSDFKDLANLALLHKSLKVNYEKEPLKIGRSLEIGFSYILKCEVSCPGTFKMLFLVKLKNPIYSIKMKSSILNSDNEAEHSEYFNAIPKDRKFVRFFHNIFISTLLNNDIRLLPNNALTLICEIEIHYKFSFKNLEGISVDYVRVFYASIVCDATKVQIETEKKMQPNHNRKIYYAGKELSIHESSLTCRSEIFLNMIDQAGLTETKESCFKDIATDELMNIIDFTCGEHILNKPIEFIITTFIKANKYAVFDLKRYCSSILSINLNFRNVCKFAVLADENNDDKLFAAAQTFAKKNLLQLIISKVWIDFVQNSFEVAKRFAKLGKYRF